MQIRRATSEDARRISYLIRKNADHVKENNYTPEQIRAWKADNTPSGVQAKLKEREIFCAFEGKRLVGTIGLKGHYVVGLYISYRKRGRGLGKQLLTFLEDHARAQNINTLHLTATPNGYGFYLKNGYISEGEIELIYFGIPFLETKMKKELQA